jgi:hypothetical protein
VSAVRSATLSKPANGYVPAETAVLPAEVLVISWESVSEFGQSHLRLRIQCDSMDLAGELLQDMVKYFKIDELQSVADFPQEYQKFEEVLKRVADCNAARMNLAADMADDSQRIKVSSLLRLVAHRYAYNTYDDVCCMITTIASLRIGPGD